MEKIIKAIEKHTGGLAATFAIGGEIFVGLTKNNVKVDGDLSWEEVLAGVTTIYQGALMDEKANFGRPLITFVVNDDDTLHMLLTVVGAPELQKYKNLPKEKVASLIGEHFHFRDGLDKVKELNAWAKAHARSKGQEAIENAPEWFYPVLMFANNLRYMLERSNWFGLTAMLLEMEREGDVNAEEVDNLIKVLASLANGNLFEQAAKSVGDDRLKA